jgi:hypothetical protein
MKATAMKATTVEAATMEAATMEATAMETTTTVETTATTTMEAATACKSRSRYAEHPKNHQHNYNYRQGSIRSHRNTPFPGK